MVSHPWCRFLCEYSSVSTHTHKRSHARNAVMHADSVFTDWGGFQAPLSIGFRGLANIQNSVFRNMHLFCEIVDVSFGGGVRFENVSLANVVLEHSAIVSTSGNDYHTTWRYTLSYDAYDDLGYDVQVAVVPEGRRGEFGEEYRIVEDVMSDCLFLRAPAGVILPGCPDASAQKREKMRAGKADDFKFVDGKGAVPAKEAQPPDVAVAGGSDEAYAEYLYDPQLDYADGLSESRETGVSKVASHPFEGLLLWMNDTWFTALRAVRLSLNSLWSITAPSIHG